MGRQKPIGRAARAFFARMYAADRCPVPGPCGFSPCSKCAADEPHPCAMGALLDRGHSGREALALAVDGLRFTDAVAPRQDAEVVKVLLTRLCAFHRSAVRDLLLSDERPEDPGEARVGSS